MKVEVLNLSCAADLQYLAVDESTVPDIEIDQWATSNHELSTSGVGPCVVIAAHNSKTGAGLLGHFASPYSTKYLTDLDETSRQRFGHMLNDLEKLGDPNDTDVWLGGARPHLYEGQDLSAAERTHSQATVTKHLQELGVAKALVDTRWTETGHGINVELDCNTGLLIVHDYPEEFTTRKRLWRALSKIRDYDMEN